MRLFGMPTRTRRKTKPDVNQTAHALAQAVVGGEAVRGEDLIDDPELRRQFLEAKQREAARKRR